ncbi:amino acid permease [Loigolactobacillus coryniformis]|uniref:amino acid permease n=1 Tax=Loigolactobacillus coryniformis TaxID=1610 RepID=UPI002648179C|nr:amino acid permease [Loigolactobacillus coryniformis]
MWGVFLSVAISGIFGYILLALVTMSIKNPLAVAQSGDNAFMTVIQQAVGGTIGQAILWLVTIAMWFCGLSAITSASRIVFAFSRDNGLPFSKLWAKVSPRYHTPAAAIWLVSGIAFLSSLSDNVYAIVTSLSVIGLYSSYFIPIVLKIRARLRGAWTAADDGPWNLRKWSMPVNLIACLWIIFLVSLMIISPSTITLTKHLTLHYATGEIFIAVIVLLCLDYYFSARKKFAGPHLGSYEGISVRLQHKSKARLAKLGLDPK